MNRKIVILIFILALAGFSIFYLYKTLSTPESAIENPPTLQNEVNNDLPAQEGLPPLVEAKRQAIYEAALSRDYEALAKEAEPAPNFHYSFGGEYEGGFVGYLKLSEQDERESAFDIIPTLLKQKYALNPNSIYGDLYTWPSVFTIEPSKWTEEDVAMMRTFLTDEQIESYRQYGGYIYYRMGITAEGKWIFYLAGD